MNCLFLYMAVDSEHLEDHTEKEATSSESVRTSQKKCTKKPLIDSDEVMSMYWLGSQVFLLCFTE